ncbi:glycosyltransferase family 4 protein [Calditrichota bacterium]
MVKHGLIVSYYFPPTGGGGVQRWTKFIKYLSRLGWQFTVITHQNSTHSTYDESLEAELPQSLKIVRIVESKKNLPVSNFKSNGSYWQRWLSAFYYIPDSRKSWNKILWGKLICEIDNSNFDVVICTIPPYSLAKIATKLTQKYSHLPVVLDMRDPWTINPYKIHPTIFHLKQDRKYENSNISAINNYVYAYQSTLDYYKESVNNFTNKSNIVIPNGFDKEDFVDLKSESLKTKSGFNIAFSGTFYSHLNNPKPLFKAIAALKAQGEIIYFHHIGKSVYDVKKLAGKLGVDNQVMIWGYQSHQKCLEILKAMDAFVVILDESVKNADKTAGGKIYEYLGFKKPILAIVPENGEATKIINLTNSGIICSYKNIQEIVEAIKKIKVANFKYNKIEQFSRESQAQQLNKFIEKIINEKNM